MAKISAPSQSIDEIIALLNGVEGRGLFSFAAETTKDALKKSRLTKEPTPARLTTVTTFRVMTVSLGNDYQQVVNSRLSKEGKESSFEAQGTYCSPLSSNKLLYKNDKTGQVYLRVYPNLCASFKTVVTYFDADGKQISDSEWKKIQAEYFPVPKPNDGQGLDNPVLVNNYKIQNVKWLKRGEILIDGVTPDFAKKVSV